MRMMCCCVVLEIHLEYFLKASNFLQCFRNSPCIASKACKNMLRPELPHAESLTLPTYCTGALKSILWHVTADWFVLRLIFYCLCQAVLREEMV